MILKCPQIQSQSIWPQIDPLELARYTHTDCALYNMSLMITHHPAFPNHACIAAIFVDVHTCVCYCTLEHGKNIQVAT